MDTRRSWRSLIRSRFTKPAACALIATFIVYFFAYQYCKYHLWRDPHSAFFNSDHVYDFDYSKIRKGEAERFIKSVNDTSNTPTWQYSLADNNPVFCAAYATIRRPETQYLTGSIGSMLDGLEREERKALYVYILFADTDPSKHPEWKAPWTTSVVDRVTTYNITEREFRWMQQMESERNFYVKGLFDYVYILEECMKTAAPYIAVFEDDIIFADGWMARLVKALAEIERDSLPLSGSDRKDDWLYLRLFHTETSLMWDKGDLLYEYIPLVLFVVSALTFFVLIILRSWVSIVRPYLDNPTILVLCVVTVPLFTALLYMMGKWTLLNPQGPTKLNHNGCCTQALVFPRTQVPHMVEYMRKKEQGQADMIIEEYADMQKLERNALFPQAVQHVGRQSSRDNSAINSQSTWGFFFEENDPLRLDKEHKNSVQKGLPWTELRNVLGR